MDVAEGIGLAALIGLLVAGVELLARYRDDPMRAVASWPAFSYTVINAAATVLAAWWLATFGKPLVAVDPAIKPPIVDA